MTDSEYRSNAQSNYPFVEIDDDAPVSRGSDRGAYVQAWVWVDDDTLPEGLGSDEDPDMEE